MGILWTVRARGLAPSLGAGGSSVVAALCCLLLATALLTFRDWPGRGGGPPDGTVTMTAPAGKAAGRVASGRAAAAVVARAAAPPRTQVAGAVPDRRSAARRPAWVPPVPARTAPRASVPAPAATSPAASAPPAPADRPAPAVAPGPVEQVVEGVRGVEEPLPPAVRQPVQPLLDTVQDVAHTVDETAAPLLPKLP